MKSFEHLKRGRYTRTMMRIASQRRVLTTEEEDA
jgi:hypothetical protein